MKRVLVLFGGSLFVFASDTNVKPVISRMHPICGRFYYTETVKESAKSLAAAVFHLFWITIVNT